MKRYKEMFNTATICAFNPMVDDFLNARFFFGDTTGRQHPLQQQQQQRATHPTTSAATRLQQQSAAAIKQQQQQQKVGGLEGRALESASPEHRGTSGGRAGAAAGAAVLGGRSMRQGGGRK